MYELCRVRLFSVGPPGARYADLILDLRDVGAVIRQPVQEALFDAEQAPVVRRPSPATVLFLENGGGKSVLMKLIFSVVLPGRRQVVGTSSTRVLEKFVGPTDVAHVLLEWQHTETGVRVVTGKVSEWRGHRVSTDPTKLSDAWYSFRPTEDLTLDTVPLTDDGRLVTLSGFKERFAEADRLDPTLQGVWRSGHKDWTDHLSSLGLDPELFRYQRDMNAGEGEAADAFTFKTDDAFVDFLLRAVTDHERPAGLADVVEGYSDKLANRGALLTERDFVAGALTYLEPLEQLHSAAVEARGRAERVRVSARRLYATVSGRCEQEHQRWNTACEHYGAVFEEERRHDRTVSRLGAVALELQRLVAELRLNRAREKQQEIRTQLSKAQKRLQAWDSCGAVLELRQAEAEATAHRNVVRNQEEAARPALDARDTAAREFACGLFHAATEADDAARAADEVAKTLRADEDKARQHADELRAKAVDLNAQAESLEKQFETVEVAVQEKIQSGVLTNGDDVTGETEAAATAARAAEQAVARAFTEQDRLVERIAVCEAELAEANSEADSLQQSAIRAAEAAQAARDLAQDLTGEPRLAELLGAETVELDGDIPELLHALNEAMDSANTEVSQVRLVLREDARVLAALGGGGLLPPPDDVDTTVELLAEAGITAWPGWRYLSQMAPAKRNDVLEQHPDLVGGVVINDVGKIDEARDVLTQARLLPRSLVAVGTTAAMSIETLAPQGPRFIVPPNPALYDEAQAEIERTAVTERDERNQQRLAALTTQVSNDDGLARRLREFQRLYPPGHRQALEEEKNRTQALYTEAAAAVEARRAERDKARKVEKTHRENMPDLHEAEQKAKARATTLSELATRVAYVRSFPAEARELRRQASERENWAQEADELMAGKRSAGDAKRDQAGEHRRTADSHRQELSQVPGAGQVSESDQVPTEPLDSLRRAFHAADETYRKVEVSHDLRLGLESAEKRESAAKEAVDSIDQEIQQLITELISSPDGGDPASRSAATRRTRHEVETLTMESESIAATVAVLKEKYEQFLEQDRSLEPYGRPTDIAHGNRLIDQVHRDLQQARSQHEEAKGALEHAESERDDAKVDCERFTAVRELLEDVAHEPGPDDTPVTAFEGSAEEAKNERSRIREALRTAQSEQDDIDREVRHAADLLAQWAAGPQFEGMTSPIRRQITAVKRDDLPRYAADWHTNLQPRLLNLNADLEQIDQHRDLIITMLATLVEESLASLRTAQRLSQLPETLGDWSGQEFLRFKFDVPAETMLHDRIAEMVDSLHEPGSGAVSKRDGISLLLRGVHAAVPKGFRVEMLKPDAVLRTERVRMSEIHDVFSGGQQLTAAIILYCTLAALRANDRGRARQRHSGVLFLDNPIGRASAGYLLELQFAVAEALGVQLVYTTGLFDSGALSVFPLIIRLRNDADLRAGLKYLSVESTVRGELDALGEPDGTGRLSATRLFHRPNGTGTPS